jgi:hypothetical protein
MPDTLILERTEDLKQIGLGQGWSITVQPVGYHACGVVSNVILHTAGSRWVTVCMTSGDFVSARANQWLEAVRVRLHGEGSVDNDTFFSKIGDSSPETPFNIRKRY